MFNFLKLKIFGKTKLLLAFEYGVHLALVAQQQKVVIDKDLMQRTEDIIENEFSMKPPLTLAQEMGQNLLAAFQPEEPEMVDTNQASE